MTLVYLALGSNLGEREAKPHRPAGQCRQVLRPLPAHLPARVVAAHGLALHPPERGEHVAFPVQHLGPQLPCLGGDVDEQVLAAEAHRPGGERPRAGGVHRREAVAAQSREPRAPACVHVPAQPGRDSRESSEVKVDPQ